MKPWVVGACLVSTWGVVQAQTVQWNVENHRHIPRGLSRRSESSFEEVVENKRSAGGYFSEIAVGNPPQNITLQLDTGSSDVWFPWSSADICEDNSKGGCPFGSFNPDKSRSFKHVGPGLFDITFIDNSYAKGDYFVDHFEFGGAVIKNLTMGLGVDTDIHFGLIGMGYASNEAVRDTEDIIYPNLPVAMWQGGYISTIAYSLWLNDLDASSGNILFGGVDTAKFTGNLTRINVLPVQGHYLHFLVALTSVVARSPSGTDTLTSDRFPIKAVLDSGTTLTYLPQDITHEIWEEVGAVYSSTYEAAVLPCSRGKHPGNFTFGFAGPDGPRITVAMDELVLDLNDGQQTPTFESGAFEGELICYFGIQNDSSTISILGNTFLRSAYVVYDLVNNEIGIAATDFNATKSEIVEFKSYGATIPSATAAPNQQRATETPEATENKFTAADGFQKTEGDDDDNNDDDDDNAASLLTPSGTNTALVAAVVSFMLIGGGTFSMNLL
ncbi:Peptidase A1 domain-containing protein [Fusarium falciforme]|uniref:Peptidase A1 domain-containing protein n=1 Tax=Fusarium falciforme TaxID=195108 RepID=UPI0023008643|nr:Peptidase A1 domain-containing protein [Fusarium falciforme]WAO83262.1 Peptidase A1 domain-containing protein [Fusarium falciforme]